jgi:hypothetical protein
VVGYNSGRRDGNINAHAILVEVGREAKKLRIRLTFMVPPEMVSASARVVPLQTCVVLLWRWPKPALEGLEGPDGEPGICERL